MCTFARKKSNQILTVSMSNTADLADTTNYKILAKTIETMANFCKGTQLVLTQHLK